MKKLHLFILLSLVTIMINVLIIYTINNSKKRIVREKLQSRIKVLANLVDETIYNVENYGNYDNVLARENSATWLASQVYQVSHKDITEILVIKKIGDYYTVEEQFWTCDENKYYRLRASSNSFQVEKIELFKKK